MTSQANQSQGNCKFGAKCALAHYLPNGHRVSKADLQPLNAIKSRDRSEGPTYPFSEQNFHDPYMSTTNYFPDIPFLEDDLDANPDRYTPAFRNGNAYDHPIGSPPTSQFGSPPNDIHSPPQRKWPSALEAPMPASYTGSVPNYAKHGHVSGSVPDRFGLNSLNSPPSSSSGFSQVVGSPPHQGVIRASSNLKTSTLGSSPAHAETSIGERMLHSERNALRSKMMPISSSVPVHDLDSKFGLDDLPMLPSGLHEEVLTPSEKMKRLSKPEMEPSSSFKDRSDGLAIPRRASAIGSPPTMTVGSPSRFRALFEAQEREKTASLGVAVGSPLRESWMLDGDAAAASGRFNAAPMSGLSAAISLSRTEMNRTDSTESNGQRTGIRNSYSRQISSPGLSGKRIDEEGDPATFFPMDDEGTRRGVTFPWNDRQSTIPRDAQNNRNSQGNGMAFGGGNRPVFGGFHE